jgi:C4-dicarboxylate transporter, DctM subunit
MEALGATFVVLTLLFLFLGLGVWIFAAMVMVSVTALMVVLDFDLIRIGATLKATMWRASSTWELSAIPLFVAMGEIIFRTDISQRLFNGLAPWVSFLPGRLLHVNIGGCTLFAAVCGSSAATTATVGKITTTALIERGYSKRLSIGSLAGAGSIGIMIPPSIPFIVYGILGEVSISRLFAAGVFPGLLVAALFSGYIIVISTLMPSLVPKHVDRYSWHDRLVGLWNLSPVLLLVTIVLGGIYLGLVTPSEAAALGLAATLLLAISMGQFTWKLFVESMMGAVETSTMIITIIVSASFMASSVSLLHVPQEVARGIASLNLSTLELMVLVSLFYIVLGCFLDGTSMIVMSLPVTLPLVVSRGVDPVWFGVFLVLHIELAMVTPPVGFNLFVLQGMTGRSLGYVAWASLPFFFLMLAAVVIISAFPQIALWLPSVLFPSPGGG